MSKSDPSSAVFKEAFNMAAATPQGATAAAGRVSAWPMVAFLSFIFATPYLIMKMVGRPDTATLEDGKNPRNWSQSIPSQALHSFHATSPQELSVMAGELVYVAPKDIQTQFRLMNTGWALATKDFGTSGMVPISYLQRYSPQPNVSVSPADSSAAFDRVFDNAPTPKDSSAQAGTDTA